MPDKTSDTIIAAAMAQLVAEGPQAMAQIVTALMNLAMRMEREQFLGAGHAGRHSGAWMCPRRPARTNPITRRRWPHAYRMGRRSCRAVMLAVAEMSVCGVSTRDAERVMAEFGSKGLSSTQVSRAANLLGVRGCGEPAPHSDNELQAWRGRTLGEVRYLFLDAHF